MQAASIRRAPCEQRWKERASAAGRFHPHMKAAVYSTHRPPDVLQIRDVEKPVPKDNEVLIKVRAAALNALDWRIVRGGRYIVRILRPGRDVAGQVEAVGRNGTQFKPGDAVFGVCAGALGSS